MTTMSLAVFRQMEGIVHSKPILLFGKVSPFHQKCNESWSHCHDTGFSINLPTTRLHKGYFNWMQWGNCNNRVMYTVSFPKSFVGPRTSSLTLPRMSHYFTLTATYILYHSLPSIADSDLSFLTPTRRIDQSMKLLEHDFIRFESLTTILNPVVLVSRRLTWNETNRFDMLLRWTSCQLMK